MKIDIDELVNTEDSGPAEMSEGMRDRISTKLMAMVQRCEDKATQSMRIMCDYAPDMYAQSIYGGGKWKYDHHGVMLVGGVGVGKTKALNLASRMFAIRAYDTLELTRVFASYGEKDFWKRVLSDRNNPIILDDLGAERDTRSYGNMSPIGEWLQMRYNTWQRNGTPTHVATNLTEKQISDRYGERVLDRLHEMCTIHGITGESMRKGEG